MNRNSGAAGRSDEEGSSRSDGVNDGWNEVGGQRTEAAN